LETRGGTRNSWQYSVLTHIVAVLSNEQAVHVVRTNAAVDAAVCCWQLLKLTGMVLLAVQGAGIVSSMQVLMAGEDLGYKRRGLIWTAAVQRC
jgi:hypothetical protein